MTSKAKTVDEYLDALPTDRRQPIADLRQTILTNLPVGFVEQICYGMIGYVVPLSIYSAGYHCDSKLPLGLMTIASQKNFIALYHMGIYADRELLKWFTDEFPKHSKFKLDMGKSCIRFKKIDQMPLELIGELVRKVTVDDWIQSYETALSSRR